MQRMFSPLQLVLNPVGIRMQTLAVRCILSVLTGMTVAAQSKLLSNTRLYGKFKGLR